MDTGPVAVVGASAAGLAVVEELRSRGFGGAITLVGDEPEPPYDRPPLSKQLLAGEWDPDRLVLRPAGHWAGLDVELLRGVAATGLDRRGRLLHLADGRALGYDAVVITTGARAVHPPALGAGLAGCHVLRDLGDALALRADLRPGSHLVVVGAGFVGAEAAAVARGMGVETTLVDPQPWPMVGAVGEDVARMLARLHTRNGVHLRCGVGVTGVVERAGRARGVLLDDGELVECDTVLVAVGARPAVGWLAGSGVPLGDRARDGVDGVLCDATGHAGDGVWAAGDVAAWRDRETGRHGRSEHRLGATEQGRAVAAALTGHPPAEAAPPYFWSEQYDVKLQSYGRIGAGLEVAVVEGDLSDGRFVAVYRDPGDGDPGDGRVCGVIGAGMAGALRTWRRAVADRAPWPEPRSHPLERTRA